MTDTASEADCTRRLVLAAVAGLGVSAVMTQLALMRELLGAFSGNELVLGISMGSWLMLTGLGTWLGRFLPRGRDRTASGPAPTSRGRERAASGPAAASLTTGLLLIAIIPLAQVVAVRVLRDVVFIRGAAVGVSGTVLGCVGLLLPFCLVSGALLAQACALLARENGPAAIGRVYLADSLGSIGGGALFSFALVPYFDHFALLCFPAAVNLLLAGALAWHFRHRLLLGSAIIIAAGLAAHLALIDADERHHRRPALGAAPWSSAPTRPTAAWWSPTTPAS